MRKVFLEVILIALIMLLCSCKSNTEIPALRTYDYVTETTIPALPALDTVTVIIWKDDSKQTCYSLFDGEVTPAPADLFSGRVFNDIVELNAVLARYTQDTIGVVYISHTMDFTKEEVSIWSDMISVPSGNYSKVTGLYDPPIITDYTPFLSSWPPLSDLPSDYSKEQAINDHVYVNIHGAEIYNQALVDAFYMDVSNCVAAFMRTMEYTIEGDPIITDYQYDGIIFTVTTDVSRDKYKGIESGDIFTDTYKYLVPLDISRAARGTLQPYYLSNEQNIYSGTSDGGITLIDGLGRIPPPSKYTESPGIIAVSGDNTISVNIYSSPLTIPFSSIMDSIHYLDLDPTLEWRPFSVYKNGEEIYGLLNIYDADTLEEIDYVQTSGIHPIVTILQYLESGHSYIVACTDGECNEYGEVVGDVLIFGINVP